MTTTSSLATASGSASEIAEQHARLSRLVVPVGGGGLVAGLLRALPGVEVSGVQPRANCAMHDSLLAGRALVDYRGGDTICEGLEGATAERTYAVARARRLAIALVDDDETLAAVGFAYRALGLVVEPSAAIAIAAAHTGRVPTDEDTVIVVTGSNIEPSLLEQAIT